MRSMVSFLLTAGEAYERGLCDPSNPPESLHLFPVWVAEAAYRNADEVAILDFDSGQDRRDALAADVHDSMEVP